MISRYYVVVLAIAMTASFSSVYATGEFDLSLLRSIVLLRGIIEENSALKGTEQKAVVDEFIDQFGVDYDLGNGRTLLMVAAYVGHCELLHYLLSCGAKRNRRDKQGRGLLDYVRRTIPGIAKGDARSLLACYAMLMEPEHKAVSTVNPIEVSVGGYRASLNPWTGSASGMFPIEDNRSVEQILADDRWAKRLSTCNIGAQERECLLELGAPFSDLISDEPGATVFTIPLLEE